MFDFRNGKTPKDLLVFSARLRQCRRDPRKRKTSRTSTGLALIWWNVRTNFTANKSNPAVSGFASRHRQTGTSSLACDGFRAQKTATFDYLPENETGNADEQIAETRDKGYGEGSFARDAEKIADHKITAFLHPKLAGNRKGRRFHRHRHALQNDRIPGRSGCRPRASNAI